MRTIKKGVVPSILLVFVLLLFPDIKQINGTVGIIFQFGMTDAIHGKHDRNCRRDAFQQLIAFCFGGKWPAAFFLCAGVRLGGLYGRFWGGGYVEWLVIGTDPGQRYSLSWASGVCSGVLYSIFLFSVFQFRLRSTILKESRIYSSFQPIKY